jgi:hypothetical protein
MRFGWFEKEKIINLFVKKTLICFLQMLTKLGELRFSQKSSGMGQ